MAVAAIDSSRALRAAVVAVGGQWASCQFELVRAVAALDESFEWALDPVPTCAHWVAQELDVEVSTAREWLRIGRALRSLPMIDAAFKRRQLSYSKVRALTRVATPDTEAELCAIANRVPAGRLAHALAAWLLRHETPEETQARQRAATGLSSRLEPDGMVVTTVRLPPVEHGTLFAALDAKVVEMQQSGDAPAGAWPSLAQQRAGALLALVTDGGANVITEAIVHVRGDGCTMDDGTPVDENTVAKLLPSAFVRLMIHEANRMPINASGRHRHPTDRQKRVVKERDRRCVDCGRGDLLQYDHDPDFDESRRTIVEELTVRCAPCHTARHRKVHRE